MAAHGDMLRARLSSYPQWPELEKLDPCPECEVPAADRQRDKLHENEA